MAWSTRRPSTNLDDRFSISTASVTRNKLRKHSRQLSVTPQEVARFASLPPTLQRKHFSREEQVLLASKINHVIFDAADEAVYRKYSQQKTPVVSYARQTTYSPAELDFPGGPDDDMDMSPEELKNFRWLDEERDLDLSLIDYHAAVAETAHNEQNQNRRRSYRRGLMISNVNFHRRSSSTNSTNNQNAWPLPAPIGPPLHSVTPNAATAAVTAGHRKNRISTSSLDPAATHYQDPAARMKLRVYLASPQKFDEAIEFGFPAMQEQNALRHGRPMTSPRSTESTPNSFLRDDTPSLSDDEDQDVEDIDSPRTPDMGAFSSTLSKSNNSSLDRPSFKPKLVRDFIDPYVHASTSNREMTLHMTLTRPDLRSPDETHPNRNINAQPLEQAPLYSTDATTFWDSLPDEEGKVKKLLRRFKLRA